MRAHLSAVEEQCRRVHDVADALLSEPSCGRAAEPQRQQRQQPSSAPQSSSACPGALPWLRESESRPRPMVAPTGIHGRGLQPTLASPALCGSAAAQVREPLRSSLVQVLWGACGLPSLTATGRGEQTPAASKGLRVFNGRGLLRQRQRQVHREGLRVHRLRIQARVRARLPPRAETVTRAGIGHGRWAMVHGMYRRNAARVRVAVYTQHRKPSEGRKTWG